jgi:hypothetical protein
MATPDHIDVGAYVLGILDPPEQAKFAEHFATCARCRAEYRELADLPRLLDQIKPEITPAPSMQALDGALAEIAATRRGRRRNLWLGAAAAGVLVVSLPIAVWQSTSDNSPAPQADRGVHASQSHTTSPSTEVAGASQLLGTNKGATAILTLDSDANSTSVELKLYGVPGPAQGELFAVKRSGDRQLVTPWVRSENESTTISRGTVDIPVSLITEFQLREDNGPVKINIKTGN